MTNIEKLKEFILKKSLNKNNFEIAKLEWQFEFAYVGDALENCPCGKSIKELCYIKNIHSNEEIFIGNVCVNKFLEINTTKLFSSLRKIKKNIANKPNKDLIDYALKNGFLYGENEYNFLVDISRKRNLNDKQIHWLHKINRRILEHIKVKR